MKFVLGIVWSMTVLKWTGAISFVWEWHEFCVIFQFLRILATNV